MQPSVPITVTHSGDGIAQLSVNRPDKRNALNMAVKTAMTEALAVLANDDTVAVVVLSGVGAMFVAGTDIAEMRDMTSQTHQELGTNTMFLALRAFEKPIIAAVEGYALGGGCELAMNCDMIVAAQDAFFAQSEVLVGIMPGAGGTQFLTRAAGRHRAARYLFTGDRFSAAEAMSMGLISQIAPPGEAVAQALALARKIKTMPPLAVSAIKQSIHDAMELPVDQALSEERRRFEALFDTDDQKEGMTAFLEKRAPQYRGV